MKRLLFKRVVFLAIGTLGKSLVPFLITALVQMTFIVGAAQDWVQTEYGAFASHYTSVTSSGGNILVGTPYGIWLSSDNGNSWHQSNTGLTSQAVNTLYTFGGKIFAGVGSGIFVSADDGVTWTQSGLQGSVAIITSINSRLIVSDSYYVYGSTDLGVTWQQSTNQIWMRAIVASNSNLVGASNTGDIFQSTDLGLTWSKISTLNSTTIFSMVANGSTIIAGTTAGVYRSNNGGATWATAPSTNDWLYSLSWFSGVFYGATSWHSVLKSTDDGVTWVQSDGWDFPAVRQTNGTDVYALNSGLAISTDNGATFSHPMNIGLTSPSVTSLASRENTILAGTYYGGIKRCVGSGDTWHDSSSGLTNSWVTSLISAGSSFLAGTYGGGVFISQDDGITWTANNNGLTNLFVTCMSSATDKIVLGTTSGVFFSSDQGGSWTAAGLTSSRVNSTTSQGNIFYASTDQGVYVSTNSGVTWSLSLASSSFFSQPLAKLGNHICIGTSNGIFFTSDNGNSWKKLSAQLDNSVITSMTTDGNNLFFNTNTGTVYTSGLNSMQLMSQKFPPVNRVIQALLVNNSTLYAGTNKNYNGLEGGSIWATPINGVINITALSPSSGKVGATVTITGSNFSSSPSDNIIEFVGSSTLNGYPASVPFFGTVTQASPTQLSVLVPPGSGSYPVKLTINGQTVTTLTPFSIIPEIKKITPSAAPIGSIIKIEGTGFDCRSLGYVSFERENSNVSYCTSTDLLVRVPGQAVSGNISFLDFDQTKYSSPLPFYVIPKIDSFYPNLGLPGTSVRILGAGFDYVNKTNMLVKFNDAPATISIASSTDMYVSVPVGARSGNITVEVAHYHTTSATPFLVTPLPNQCFDEVPKPVITIKSEDTFAVLHSNAKGENLWFKNGEHISGVSDSVLTVNEPGSYSVQSQVNGCLSPMSDPIEFIITEIEPGNWNSIELFPNPTTSSLTVNLKSAPQGMVRIDAYDLMGRSMIQTVGQGGSYVELDMKSCPPGVYLIRVMYADVSVKKKIIKN